MMKKSLILLLAGLLCLLPAACSPEDDPLEEVTLLLDWTPNTNFSGIYTAAAEGYYAEEGLKVDVIQAPGSVAQMVAAGQAEFGFSYQEEVTFARLAGMPLLSIAAVLGHNTSGFASLREKGIETPADFAGRSYGGWGAPVEEATIKTLMENHGADFTSVDIITTGEVDSLIVIEREADFAWIFYGWTGIEAELKGMDLNFIALGEEDPALDYYTPVIISSESLADDDPEVIERFMRATSRGYELTMAEPEKAARHLLDAAPELDEELVLTSQEWLSPRYKREDKPWGYQEKETWAAYSRWLHENELTEELLVVEEAFTNRFLP